jgi:3-oxoadipate enol-lactonase
MEFVGRGLRLDYDDEGRGLPLLLVHGFPLDRTLWNGQVDGLRNTCRLIVPDLRGFGASSATDGAAVSMDDYADDLAALLGSVGVDRVILGGLSMGGYIALAFAARHGDRLAGLILANTRAGADTEAGRQGRLTLAAKIEAGGTRELVDSMAPKMLAPASGAELDRTVRTMMSRQSVAAVTSALRGMAERPDRGGMLSSIDVPTLIIGGRDDALIPTAESEAMQGAIPGSRLVMLPEAGHLSNLEQPARFNQAVLDLIGRVGPS